MDSLLDARHAYMDWLGSIKELVQEMNLSLQVTSLFFNKVWDHGTLGGAGAEYGDQRSWDLRSALQEETKNNIQLLDTLRHHFATSILEKRDGNFYYLGTLIVMDKNTTHYQLLDCLMQLGDENGFVSYDALEDELERRRMAKIFAPNTLEIVTKKTITNALDSLFRHARISGNRFVNLTPRQQRLIQVRRGKGLVLNNEDVE